MGAFDSAEVCDLIGLFMLHQLRNLGIIIGLYRDDGLAISDKAPNVIDDIKKEMHRTFADHGLKITTNVNRKTS